MVTYLRGCLAHLAFGLAVDGVTAVPCPCQYRLSQARGRRAWQQHSDVTLVLPKLACFDAAEVGRLYLAVAQLVPQLCEAAGFERDEPEPGEGLAERWPRFSSGGYGCTTLPGFMRPCGAQIALNSVNASIRSFPKTFASWLARSCPSPCSPDSDLP
jgi:hypothetical protein